MLCTNSRAIADSDKNIQISNAAYEKVGKNENENTQYDSENSYLTVAALTNVLYVFTARHYATAIYAMALCPSVSVCVCDVSSCQVHKTLLLQEGVKKKLICSCHLHVFAALVTQIFKKWS